MSELEEMIAHAKTVVFRSDSGHTVKLVRVRRLDPAGPHGQQRHVDRWTIWIEGGSFVNHRRGEQAFFETFEEAYRAGMSMPYPAKQARTFLLPKLAGHRPGGGVNFGFARRFCIAFACGAALLANGCTGGDSGANLGPGWVAVGGGACLFAMIVAAVAFAGWLDRLAPMPEDPKRRYRDPCTCHEPQGCPECRRRYLGEDT